MPESHTPKGQRLGTPAYHFSRESFGFSVMLTPVLINPCFLIGGGALDFVGNRTFLEGTH